jgi:hypothetical protein
MKSFLSFLLLGISPFAIAQQSELGISLLSAYVNGGQIITNYQSANPNASSNQSNSSYYAIRPVLMFTHVNVKGNVFLIQGGFFYTPNSSKNTLDRSQFGHAETTFSSLFKSLFLKLGIARRVQFENFYLDLGLNIPLEYQFYGKSFSKITDFDWLDQPTYTTHSNYVSPDMFTTGINAQISIYYKITRRFAAGVDLNVGLYTIFRRGTQVSESSTEYFGGSGGYQAYSQSDLIKNNFTVGMNTLPALSIRYTFSKMPAK